MLPNIDDHGTHYVTNQKLSLEMLKEMCYSKDVIQKHNVDFKCIKYK